ncbi:MAG: S8 family serine peptidase, partial [Eggerthellaceae bacterium]|nr:S8 family serine peptidase [Eggerthellaceae bacterium]
KLSLPDGMSPAEAPAALASTPSVAFAEPNLQLYTQEQAGLVASALMTVQSVVADDPAYVEGKQWSLDNVDAPGAWAPALVASEQTAPVTVAVIDAGFYVAHEDLKDNVVAQYDATTGASVIRPDNPVYSEIDHGTHAAGIVAARTNNATGVASIGYNLCNVLPIRVQDTSGAIYESSVVRAYDYILAHADELNIRVANMSLGAAANDPVTTQFSALHEKIDQAREAGVVTVVAACNSGTKGYNDEGVSVSFTPPFYAYPSDFDGVVSVIALAEGGAAADNGVNRMSSSNYNVAGQRSKNISAPGGSIWGLYGGASEYGYKGGTSMAAPLVAGTLGLMFRANPDLTADRAVQALYESARDLTQGTGMGAGWDDATGYGEIDAAAAVADALDARTFPMSGCTVKLSATSLTYTGKAVKPSVKSVTMKIDGENRTLVEGIDYKLTNSGVVKGTGKVTVKGMGRYTGTATAKYTVSVKKLPVYELYNKKTGEWFYTTSAAKRTAKLKAGFTAKGTAWKAPSKSTVPVYFKKSGTKMLYTTKKTSQGVAFYSYGNQSKAKPVYRYYNAKTKTYRYSLKKLTSSAYKRKSTLFYAV